VTEDTYRKLAEQMQRQMAPLAALQESAIEQRQLRRLVEDMTRQHDLLCAAFDPIEELRQTRALATLAKQDGAINQAYREIDTAHSYFTMPEFTQVTELLAGLQNGPVAELTAYSLAEKDAIALAAMGMQTPWLDTVDQLRSVSAFADLQGIGLALQTMPSFSDQFTDLLRDDLGDWRDQIAWPEKIFNNAIARTMFYEERGFDPALTAFPAAAFEQGLDIAGLRRAPPDLIDHYNYEEARERDKEDAREAGEEEAFARNNVAHDRLQRFESQLRLFIDEQMTEAFGPQWIKRRVPGSMRESWVKKREVARANGEREHPLIAYADFSDYAPIITQRNNWSDVFKPIFGRQTSVQESLQRLYPIRICTMHARMITQDDEIYLHVETRRILIAIGAG